MNVKPWKDWRILVSLLLFVSIGWAIFSKQSGDLSAGLKQIQAFHPLTLICVPLLGMLQVLGMGMRVWSLTPRRTRIRPVLWAITYGQFANAFFPARAGDALKIFILMDSKKGSGIPLTTAAGIFVGDKILDLIGLLLWVFFSGAYSLKDISPPAWLWTWKTLFIIVVIHVILIWFWKKVLENRFPKFAEKLLQIKLGMRTLTDWRHTLPALLFSVFVWGAEILALTLLLQGQNSPLPIAEVVATLVILNMAISIAVSVANLGTFEASVVFALSKFGIATAPAIAVATTHHALQLVGTGLATLLAWALLSIIKPHAR